MAESIGSPCECIFGFEKSIITGILDSRIEELKRTIETMEKTPPEKYPDFAQKQELLRMNKFVLTNVELVKKRIEATPEC